LDLSENSLGVEGAKIVAEAIPRWFVQLYFARFLITFFITCIFADMRDSGLLSKLTFSGDSFMPTPVTVEVGMTEADFSGAILQQSGAIILAAWLKQKVQHDSD
jgi:hypothetical protein